MSATSSEFVHSKLEDLNVTHDELNSIGEALKKEEFRKLLIDYVQEIQNPENRRVYEEELTLLEKQRGVDVKFVTPTACFVVKTSSNGNVKTFINICSNENIGIPASTQQKGGLNWQVPYVLAPPRLDFDKKHEKCNVYDVVFHPQSIELGNKSKDFRQLIIDTACNGIEQSFKVSLDKVNLKFPNISFKGSVHPTILRKKCESLPADPEEDEATETLVQKAYNQTDTNKTEPDQHETPNGIDHTEGRSHTKSNGSSESIGSHSGMSNDEYNAKNNNNAEGKTDPLSTPLNFPYPPLEENKPIVVTNLNKTGEVREEYATPSHVIKEYSEVSLDNYRNDKYCKSNIAIPSKLIVEIKLPLLKTMEFTKLDILGKQFEFVSEKPSKYKLNIKLPYAVDDENGTAKFELDKKLLVVTLPVVYDCEKDGLEWNETNIINDDYEESENLKIEANKVTESCNGIGDSEVIAPSIDKTHQICLTDDASSALESGTADPAIPTPTCSTNNKHEIHSAKEIQTSSETPVEVQNNASTNYLEVTDSHVLNVIKENNNSDLKELEISHDILVAKPKLLIEEIETDQVQNKHEKGFSIEGLNTADTNENSNDEQNESNDTKCLVENKNNTDIKEKNEKLTEQLKEFFNSKVFYAFPEHTVNASGTQLVFVFNVNNVEKDSVKFLLFEDKSVMLQFVSVGSGFYRSHYGLRVRLNHPVSVESFTASTKNVILKMVHTGSPNSCYYVANVQDGEENKVCIPEPEYYMDLGFENQQESNQAPSPSPKPSPAEQSKDESNMRNGHKEESSQQSSPVDVMEEEDKENHQKSRGKSDKMDIPKSKSTSSLCDNGQQYRVRGILKTCSRSLSISSDEDEDDHYSSSCSVKKHVRFDDHISRKLFSTKCTILEQEKKYQKRLRHLSHKRERRASETEVSDGENNRKHLSKKQQKKQSRNARGPLNNNNGGTIRNGAKNENKENENRKEPSANEYTTETSEDESKTTSCSATSESGEETSDSGDCAGESKGQVEVLASRKSHRRRGKKNARRVAADAKGVFQLDMN